MVSWPLSRPPPHLNLLPPCAARAEKQPANELWTLPALLTGLSKLGIGVEQLRLLMVPGKRVFHALAAILAHVQAPLWRLYKLQDLLREIQGIVRFGVERSLLRG